ncbi:hypothetical protein [Maridesulfovibrio sp.]|uniref:beta strand repeat-containing protein n=1 Tax=Maridesulfovibrio sp. TaxID=2795000 RepID=UPI0029F5C864|nr:hypothetical protein [Maridesulfovibrio sp.]
MKMSKKMKQAITVAAIAGTMALSGTAFAATSGWKTQTLGATGSALSAIALDAGAVGAGSTDNNAVVVGNGGKIYTISNVLKDDMKASDWTSATVPSVSNLNAVASYAADSFVAVGTSGAILISTDNGKEWKKVAKVSDEMAGEDFLYVAANGGKVVVATATKLFYTAAIASTTDPAWKEVYLTADGTASGADLSVGSDLKGIAWDTGNYIWAFGGASSLARVNVTGGTNTAVADMDKLTIATAYDVTPTTEELGSVTFTGIAAGTTGHYITTADGKVLHVTINGGIATPVVTADVSYASDGTAAAQAWTQPTTEKITSISSDPIVTSFVTSSGSIYRIAMEGTGAITDKWVEAKDLTSKSLNSVLMTTTRGVAAGEEGIMGSGKDVEWTEKTEYDATAGFVGLTSAGGYLYGSNATDPDKTINYGTTYGEMSGNTITTTGVATAGANGQIISSAGDYAAVLVLNTTDGLAVVKGKELVTEGVSDDTVANLLAGQGSTAAVVTGAESVKYYVNAGVAGGGTKDGLSIALNAAADGTPAKGFTNDVEVDDGTNALTALGYTSNGRVWGSAATSKAFYVLEAADAANYVGTADFDLVALGATAYTAKITAGADTVFANGGKYAYVVDGGDFYIFPESIDFADAGYDKELYKISSFVADDTKIAKIWSEGDQLYGVDASTAATPKVFKLILDETNLFKSQWVYYGTMTVAAGADGFGVAGDNLVVAEVGTDGDLFTTSGPAWTQLADNLSLNSNFADVTVSGGTFYAVGNDAMLYSSTDGTNWTLNTDFVEAFPAANLSIVRANGSNIYVLDNGTKRAYKYDGTAWARIPSASKVYAANTVDMIMTGDDEGLMLTDKQVYNFADFTSKAVSGLSGANKFAQLSSSSYFIVADGGKAWTYDGDSTLTAVTFAVSTAKNLNDLYVKSSSEVYIAGNSGYFAKYDGEKVTAIDTGSSVAKGKSFTNVWGYDNFVFLTDGTNVYKYDGANFFTEQVQSGNINEIDGSKDLGLVAVGNSGTVQFRAIGNSGLINYPGAKDTMTYVTRSSVATTPDTLNSTYGVDNSTLKLLGDQMTFTGTIAAGKTATVGFSFEATDNASNTSEIGLIKLIGGAGNALKHYYFNQTDEVTTDDGKYWITSATPETDGSYKPVSGDLTKGEEYYVWFNIKDNGNGDLDATAGKITDPVVATTSGGATISSSSSSGCVFNPAAGFGLEWLMLMAAPMIAVIRNRFKK